jgi:hypothetical protein
MTMIVRRRLGKATVTVVLVLQAETPVADSKPAGFLIRPAARMTGLRNFAIAD